MMKVVYILGFAAIAANIFFIWYMKRHGRQTKPPEPSIENGDDDTALTDFLATEEGKKLKESAAAELNITVEDLDRMPVEEITELAKEMELI
jgi:hypothetical protein